MTNKRKTKKGDTTVRGQKIMLSTHLAELYGVETKQLKRTVRRNINRFPEDFMFQLSDEEFENLKSHLIFRLQTWSLLRSSKMEKLPFSRSFKHAAIVKKLVI